MIVTDDCKFSSNISEVIRAVLFYFILRFHKYKTAYSKQKYQNTHKKTSKTKKVTYSLICVLCFYIFSAFSKSKESIHFFTSLTKLDFICIVLVY